MTAVMFRYPIGEQPLESLEILRGGVRRVEFGGRAGWALDDPWSGIRLGPHTLDASEGSLVLTVLPLEELSAATRHEHHFRSLTDADQFTLASDRECVHRSESAHFAITWQSGWHPGLWVKRFSGPIYRAYKGEPLAAAAAGHFSFSEVRWWELAYVWKDGMHRLYVDGVLVATENHFARGAAAVCEPWGPILFVGNALFATSEVRCYDRALKACELGGSPAGEWARPYSGEGLPAFEFDGAPGWETRVDAPLNLPGELSLFHVQGCSSAPRVEADGLRVTTPDRDPTHDASRLDVNQVYLWSRQVFFGDLYVRFEFRTHRKGGLALLMTQASGMQGEDFLSIHPVRETGSMAMVAWEDIRNYHWEFYREMNDVRNDVATHAMLKNPWFKPMGFQVDGPLYQLGEWQIIEFLQEGRWISAAVNRRLLFRAEDNPFDNNGPTLSRGRIALRCMTRTDVTFRNLLLMTRPRHGLRITS